MADFSEVKQHEDGEIAELRRRRGMEALGGKIGLAFSGGGIRSATFNLGVLQGLATYRLLSQFDYISTVSGGGYIGSWLISWIKRSGVGVVEKALASAPPRIAQTVSYTEPRPINFLRDYSNYLTPQLGLLSADTWSTAAIIIRNLLLNLTIIVCFLAALLLLPHFGQLALQCLKSCNSAWMAPLAPVLIVIGLSFVTLNLGDFSWRGCAAAEWEEKTKLGTATFRDSPAKSLDESSFTDQKWVLLLAATPIFLAAVFGSFNTWSHIGRIKTSTELSFWLWEGAISYFVVRLLGIIGGWSFLFFRIGKNVCVWRREIEAALIVLITAPVAGLFGGFLFQQLAIVFQLWAQLHDPPVDGPSLVAAFGPPLLIVIILLTGVLHIGLMGLLFTNQRREWWARLGGWLLIASAVWAMFFVMSFYAPLVMSRLSGWAKSKDALIGAWVVSTLSGLLAGKSSKTSGKTGASNLREVVALVSPYVFVVGLLAVISYGIHHFVPFGATFAAATDPKVLTLLSYSLVGLLFVMLILAWRVDINEFSMHLLYRNRLVRCYLGASNVERDPQRFTGFDPADDVLLAEFSTACDKQYSGPYPIFNAALNVTHGEKLAWQERKAESFVFTPGFSGYHFQEEHETIPRLLQTIPLSGGYCPTQSYAYKGGVYLGTACAISGAAASPNMGYHTSPALAFPHDDLQCSARMVARQSPPWDAEVFISLPSLLYLLFELFSNTSDRSRFIYLSDGGHFENLGLYELVRRGCRYILVSDAGADREMKFGDLGNAIRKCRSDFGVEITLAVNTIQPTTTDKNSNSHFVLGTIQYPDGNEGQLLYIKTSITGNEPQDVLSYKAAHPEFPHQTTADQWFRESQFESYRALGRFVMESILDRVGKPKQDCSVGIKELFKNLPQT